MSRHEPNNLFIYIYILGFNIVLLYKKLSSNVKILYLILFYPLIKSLQFRKHKPNFQKHVKSDIFFIFSLVLFVIQIFRFITDILGLHKVRDEIQAMNDSLFRFRKKDKFFESSGSQYTVCLVRAAFSV